MELLMTSPSAFLLNKFKSLKDPWPLDIKTDVLYQNSCENWPNAFILETKKRVIKLQVKLE